MYRTMSRRTGTVPFCPRNRRRRFPITNQEKVLSALDERSRKGEPGNEPLLSDRVGLDQQTKQGGDRS